MSRLILIVYPDREQPGAHRAALHSEPAGVVSDYIDLIGMGIADVRMYEARPMTLDDLLRWKGTSMPTVEATR